MNSSEAENCKGTSAGKKLSERRLRNYYIAQPLAENSDRDIPIAVRWIQNTTLDYNAEEKIQEFVKKSCTGDIQVEHVHLISITVMKVPMNMNLIDPKDCVPSLHLDSRQAVKDCTNEKRHI